MDILREYEKQNPHVMQQAPQRQPTPEHGFFIRLVMRLSGGRIENARQASYVLLGITMVFFLLSLIFFFNIFGFAQTAKTLVPVETKGPLPQ